MRRKAAQRLRRPDSVVAVTGDSMNARRNETLAPMSLRKRAAITSAGLLLAGQAFATFELKDPAAEIYEEKPASADDATGQSPCIDLLRDSAGNEESYAEKLAWMRAVFDGLPGGTALESESQILLIDRRQGHKVFFDGALNLPVNKQVPR